MRHPQRSSGHFTLGLCVLASAVLLGCGGSDGDMPPRPVGCADLNGMAIAAGGIALPTAGAVVTAATAVAASGSGASAVPAFCRVSASISPVDTSAPKILLQVALPEAWNSKVMMFGGGGYNGSIPSVTGNVPAGPTTQGTPLGRGYATFSSDSGHQAGALGSQDGSFGVNDEAVRNFSGDALKKTRDVAMAILKARYAVAAPTKAYFAGGSTGGREALAVAQRWPQDWDGVIALYPAGAAASLDLQFGRITRALAQPGAYPSPAKRKKLYDASMQACDALDGVADGLISDSRSCNARFNPLTATVDGMPLRCTGGLDTGDSCLSDAQIAAFQVINTPITFGYPLASGETQYPGFNTWGTDFGVPHTSPLQANVSFLSLSSVQPASPMPNGAPYGSVFWDQWVRFFVTRDPAFHSLALDPQNPGPYQARISALSGLQDVNQVDLSAFQAKGGKMLIAHGTGDALVSTRATAQYVERVRAAMGPSRADTFLRYYEIPGYGHAVSTVFNASWDSLSTLENWVEKSTQPPNQIVTDTAGVPGRTRPLCDYPSYPRYKGSGDINLAASFSCATP